MSLAGVVSGGVGGLGRALMLRSERERQDTLLTRKENREDLVTAREDAIADARQLRQQQFQERIHQMDSDREASYHQDVMKQQRDLAGQSDKTTRELAGQQNTLQRDRWDREDRRQVEESAGQQLAALDKRIQTVQDAMLKGEYLGKETEAQAELEEAKEQQRVIRYRSMRQLAEQGDPRYKDMGARDLALAAGFSRERIAELVRQAGQNAGPATPTAPGPAGAPMATPPESPPPITDLSKKGRGNKAAGDLFAPANGRGAKYPTVTGRGGAQITDLGALFKMQPNPPKKYGGGRGAPQPPDR